MIPTPSNATDVQHQARAYPNRLIALSVARGSWGFLAGSREWLGTLAEACTQQGEGRLFFRGADRFVAGQRTCLLSNGNMTISRSHTRAQQTLGRALGLAAGLTLAANFGCSSSTEPQDGTGAAGASSSAGSSSSSGGSSKGGQPSSAGTASQGASGGSGSDTLLGSFKIEVTADEGGPTSGKTSVLGKVVSGATPASVVWEVTKTEGTCRLEKPRVPFCSPACGSAVCVEDDVCQPYPDALSVGAVTLSGVKDAGGGATLTLKE